MEKTGWKTLAIIFICLFAIETGFIAWSYNLVIEEEEKTYECLYNFCSENYDADYLNGICTCYDLDVMGDYFVSKTKYIK